MRGETRLASGALFGFGAFLLAFGGAVHVLAFKKASSIADQSTLPSFFSSTLKGLWLADSVSSMMLALLFVLAAARPQWMAPPVLIILALMPTALAVVVFATMGNFFAGYIMLTAGAAALAGAGLDAYQRQTIK